MFSWHCMSNAVKVMLVLCCINQTWGHLDDTYRNLTNSAPSKALNVRSTSTRGATSNWQEDSDEITSKVSTLLPGIQLSHSRGKDGNISTSSPINTSTALPLKVTPSDQLLYTATTGLPLISLSTSDELNNLNTENDKEFPINYEAHTLGTNMVSSNSVNNSTEVERVYINRGNTSMTDRPPQFPARHTNHRDHGDEASEHGLQTTQAPNERESRGHPDEHEGVNDEVSGAGQRKDLCATCLCDAQKLHVYCKHEHLYNGESHRLRLTRALLPPIAITLRVQGFERVVIVPDTFSADNLTLRKIHFEDIGEVELHNGSLRFSPMASENLEVQIQFTRCHIPELPTTTLAQYARSKDQRSDINLERTRFLSLYIEKCNITTIRTNAVYQARLLYFTMSHTKVELMERQGIHIDIYEDWKVESCELPQLVPKAISLRAQRVVIFSKNLMIGLANRSLDILSSNQVLFEFNHVSHLGSGALLGVQPYEGQRGANIVFLNNTVAKAENGSLAISSQYPLHERKVLGNRFHELCSCQIREVFRRLLGTSKEGGQVTLDAVLMKSRCQRFPGVVSFSRVDTYLEDACTNLPIPIIVSTVTVAIAILITVIVSIICIRRAQKAREEANYLGECSYSHSFSTLHSNPGPLSPTSISHSWERSGAHLQPWVMAVPEVKTYQETELHVDYEHTEPFNGSVRGSFPPEPGPILDLLRKTQMRSSCPFN